MERLIRAKLFGSGLVAVDTPELVARYNHCLEELGIAPTEQPSFQIDGLGWSPEVAREKDDMYYLSAGIANQMGIILSPSQRNKPLYFPYHSYDRNLLDDYFARYKSEIADITLSRGITLDIDHELTAYSSPTDLRLVQYIVVRSSCGALAKVAARQKELSDRLLAGDEWRNNELRAEIMRSAAEYGDLRYRKTAISDFRFEDVKTFYTRAFGGVFVLTTLDGASRLLVLENHELGSDSAWRKDIFTLRAPETLDLLFKESLLELNLDWYQAYPQVLGYIKECLMAEIICRSEPELTYSGLTPMQRKKRIVALGDAVCATYFELEKLIIQLRSARVPRVEHLSPDLRLLLLRPARNLSLGDQQVLRQLLHRLVQIDVVQLYADDKILFFEQYQNWPESKRVWAVERISQDYILEASKEKEE